MKAILRDRQSGEPIQEFEVDQPLPDILLVDGKPFVREQVGDGKAFYVTAKWIHVTSAKAATA